MGRPAFTRFLNTAADTDGREPGVWWQGEFASWNSLLAAGRQRAGMVRRHHAYLVDPDAGLSSLVSLFAVATVPDTVLFWATAATLTVPRRELAPGLSEVDNPVPGPVDRPLWGVCTSGSSGAPKVAIGHADLWELVALHYEQAMFRPAFDTGAPPALATCLPPQFSAAFFMTVLPSLFLRRDLVIFPPHDWSPVQRPARRGSVLVLGVPAIAAAACLGSARPVDMREAVLFLGGGHLGAQRVDLIRDRFTGVRLANLYGTAETGAIAVDHDPGHNAHVGHPIPGKAVWLAERDDCGVGAIAVAGPDCCRYRWQPGGPVVPTDGYVTGTDYGRFDEDGHLCLEGRIDGGEKMAGVLVYPRAVERHLLTLAGVADARVLVRRAPNGLEHLVARVVGDVDERAVREHCATLPEAERPGRIECVAERDAATAYSAHGKL